jgi:DNA-binding NtrC family response regulator
VVMPKMGGRELIEALKRERPFIRVLYMSGYAASTIDEQDVVEPGTSFLRKPFALAEMLRKVREVLDEGTSHGSGPHRVAQPASTPVVPTAAPAGQPVAAAPLGTAPASGQGGTGQPASGQPREPSTSA